MKVIIECVKEDMTELVYRIYGDYFRLCERNGINILKDGFIWALIEVFRINEFAENMNVDPVTYMVLEHYVTTDEILKRVKDKL